MPNGLAALSKAKPVGLTSALFEGLGFRVQVWEASRGWGLLLCRFSAGAGCRESVHPFVGSWLSGLLVWFSASSVLRLSRFNVGSEHCACFDL